jgi:4-hydroxy-tetrahydrodipicolinate synthase
MMPQDRASVIVALLTPFDERGRVDIGAFEAHVTFLAERGVDAVMTAGTTGEGALLDPDEVVVVAAAAVRAGGGMSVLAHVGRPATEDTIDLACRALDVGVGAIVAVVPYYHRLTDGQIRRHYRALMNRCGPERVFAYTIPALTVNDLAPASVRSLAEEGLAGIKDSTKSFRRHLAYLQAVRASPQGCRVYMGSDDLVLQSLRAGSAGAVSAIANARPNLLISLRDAFDAGQDADADRLREELRNERTRLSRGPALASLKRAAARELGKADIAYPIFQRAPLG